MLGAEVDSLDSCFYFQCGLLPSAIRLSLRRFGWFFLQILDDYARSPVATCAALFSALCRAFPGSSSRFAASGCSSNHLCCSLWTTIDPYFNFDFNNNNDMDQKFYIASTSWMHLSPFIDGPFFTSTSSFTIEVCYRLSSVALSFARPNFLTVGSLRSSITGFCLTTIFISTYQLCYCSGQQSLRLLFSRLSSTTGSLDLVPAYVPSLPFPWLTVVLSLSFLLAHLDLLIYSWLGAFWSFFIGLYSHRPLRCTCLFYSWQLDTLQLPDGLLSGHFAFWTSSSYFWLTAFSLASLLFSPSLRAALYTSALPDFQQTSWIASSLRLYSVVHSQLGLLTSSSAVIFGRTVLLISFCSASSVLDFLPEHSLKLHASGWIINLFPSRRLFCFSSRHPTSTILRCVLSQSLVIVRLATFLFARLHRSICRRASQLELFYCSSCTVDDF